MIDDETLEARGRTGQAPARIGDAGAEAVRTAPIGEGTLAVARPERGTQEETRYEILGKLGSGGMGIVLLVRDLRLRRQVAVKLLRQEVSGDGVARQQFEEEAVALAGLDHPGIVPVYETGTLESGEPFYAMKRVKGQTLDELLSARSAQDTRSRETLMHFVDVFERVCQTVAAAHRQGWIHRDIKPSNVMVDEFGSVYVMDWGIALRVGVNRAPRSNPSKGISGTPAYMSPEQARGETTGPPSDVFSLGVMLYEILTGTKPFTGSDGHEAMRRVQEAYPSPPLAVNRTAGRALSAVCMRALAKDPRDRYESAVEFAEEIRRFREFRPVNATRPTVRERLVNWMRRHPAAAAGAATAVAAVLLGVAGYSARVATHHAVYARALRRLDDAEADLARAEASLAAVAAAREAARGAERVRLTLEIEQLRAVRDEEFETAHGLAYAILGFGATTPDAGAQQRARRYKIEGIDRFIAAGQDLAAEASLRKALDNAATTNQLGFTPDDVAAMHRKLAQVEARLATHRDKAIPAER